MNPKATRYSEAKADSATLRDLPLKLKFDQRKVEELCLSRGISRLELFGSALREDFRETSDIDLLATVRSDAELTLLDWADLQQKLSQIFGRAVDLVSRRAIERSKNLFRRDSILSTALLLYVER